MKKIFYKYLKNMKNPFRYVGEKYAYLQAYLDDTILYTTKKLQEQSQKSEETDLSQKPLGKKVLHYTGIGLSKSIGEAFTGFYETYTELKKGENLAQKTVETDIPKIKIKAKLLKEKMKLLNLEKGNIKDLKKLKD